MQNRTIISQVIFKGIRRGFLFSNILVFGFFLPTQVIFAEISQFVFSTPAQTILSSTLSGPLTIQSQNESGVQVATAETIDLAFTSTSPTGQFLSSTGKAVSKTMSKGTANRTFYYSDSTLGSPTITVTATGRTSKQSFSASQQITIASVLPVKPAPIIKSSTKTTTKGSTKVSVSKTTKASTPTIADDISDQIFSNQTTSTSSANVATVYEGVKQTSIFDSLFDWPENFWYWLVHIFKR